ncbi:MAG: type II toxin-antitoxin system HicB family antitoxin [Bacteroidota bacterium]|nr:type II toxin-antitoxin system HicB family antitoxin [Bacteroidota bacterium]
MEKYLVIIEKAENNYSAFSPDVPGCVATGTSVEDTTTAMKEALEFHLEEANEIPRPKGMSQHIEDGIFKNGEVAEVFFITEVAVQISHHA